MIQTGEWFISNIGNTIYRDHHKCCDQCDEIVDNGLQVMDKQHANYLYDVQNDYGREWVHFNYRSIK